MINEGKHKIKIVGSYTGESSEKKTPFIGLELETEKGELIDWIAYMTENTQKRNLETLISVGFVGKKISDLSSEKYETTDLFKDVMGGLTATIKHEDYQNKAGETKMRAVVQWLNAASGPDRFDHVQAVKTFNSMDSIMNGLKKDLNPRFEKTEEKASEQESEEFTSDDIPF